MLFSFAIHLPRSEQIQTEERLANDTAGKRIGYTFSLPRMNQTRCQS